VTFQLGLVGCDGLVIASDRLARYDPLNDPVRKSLVKIVTMSKYFVNRDQSLICFAAGGATAIDLGRQIIEDSNLATLKNPTDQEWESAVNRVGGATSPTPLSVPADEILIARRGVFDAFWLVLRRPGSISKTLKIDSCLCTGQSTVAQFLPRHLWNKDLSVSVLKKLAILTLSYAANEEPSYVGPPFDVMTLEKSGNLTWTVHAPTYAKFQSVLEKSFTEATSE
jgi:hypothetical protein